MSDMDQWQLESSERLARIEQRLEHITDTMTAVASAYPAVQQNVKDIAELKEHHTKSMEAMDKKVGTLEKFKDEINIRVAYVGGVLVTIGMAVPYAIQWVMNHLHWRG